MSRGASLVVVIVLASGALGCSGGRIEDKFTAARPPTVKVSGVVTLKQAPVEGAIVTLHPVQGGAASVGTTDAQGRYSLMTFEKGDGAVAGEYKVSVRKLAPPTSGPAPSPDDPNYDPNPKVEPPKHLLPEKYADFNKSELTATISSVPRTDLDFDLAE